MPNIFLSYKNSLPHTSSVSVSTHKIFGYKQKLSDWLCSYRNIKSSRVDALKLT